MAGRWAAIRGRVAALRYGFLFLPIAVTVLLALFAVLMVRLDRLGGTHGLGFGFSAEADAARTVLGTIAGSLITVAGLTFSITIVTLQLVSQQFTPRILRSFVGDRVTQFVAGFYVGIFLYCLLVLRSVRNEGPSGGGFVPAAAVSVSFGLAIAALVLLLVFINRMASSIQVSTIAARIARSTRQTLGELYPEPFGTPTRNSTDDLVESWRARAVPHELRVARAGYVQAIALDDLPDACDSPGIRLELLAVPGDFVTEHEPVGRLWFAPHPERLERKLLPLVTVGSERDIAQDPGYGIRQLIDIAVRALSPGVNDPTTAVTCVGYLASLLGELAGRGLPSPVREFPDADLVVVARRRTFEELVDSTAEEIGRHARADARVSAALLDCLRTVAIAAARAGADDRLEYAVAVGRRLALPTIEAQPAGSDRTLVQDALERLLAVGDAPAVEPARGRSVTVPD